MIVALSTRTKNQFENDGKHWTADDYKNLCLYYEQGHRWGTIAAKLGRTVPACVVQLRALRKFSRLPKNIWRPRPVYELPTLDVANRR